jgi:organic hydroperoxide reductase OsmC/OhrA
MVFVRLPDMKRQASQALVDAAHTVCPSSLAT